MSIKLGELVDGLARVYKMDRDPTLCLVSVYAAQLGVEGAGEQLAAENVEVSDSDVEVICRAFASAAYLDMLDSAL